MGPSARATPPPARSGDEAATDLTAELDLDARPQRTDLHDPRRREEVEAALADVPGLIGARIVPGFDRQVDEVHVLTTIDRNAKQTVRDVQTVLMARFGVPTDHRVISVVQLEEGRGLPIASRVAIEQVGLMQTGLTVVAEVILRDGEAAHRGTSESASTTSGRHRAIAQATLVAVRELIEDSDLVIELEGVDLVDVGGRRLAATVLQLRSPRGEELLSGAAMVRDAPQDAIARSVLDAMNRTITDAPR